MTTAEELEHRYRRWLRWYPPAFRREYEAEMLGVLLAGARDGQRRPRMSECLDLMANGLRLRLRPGLPRDAAARVRLSVLIYVGALLELAAATVILATSGSVRAALIDRRPGFTEAQWQAVLAGQLEPVVLAACVAAAFWVGLGRAVVRGHGWARVAFAILAAVNGYGLVAGLAGGSASVAQADLVVGVALCLVQLLAVLLMFDQGLARLGRRLMLPGRLARPAEPWQES